MYYYNLSEPVYICNYYKTELNYIPSNIVRNFNVYQQLLFGKRLVHNQVIRKQNMEMYTHLFTFIKKQKTFLCCTDITEIQWYFINEGYGIFQV